MVFYWVYLYHCCNSLIRASKALEPYVTRSHASIWRWVQLLAPVCDWFEVDRRRVRTIFVGKTVVRNRTKRP